MIYVMLADGFEDIEAIAPVDILRRAEIDVQTVGIADKTVTSAHGITVLSDIEISAVVPEKMDMLVLPGGAGYQNLEKSERVQELIAYAEKNNIYIAAICASPSILGKLGLLNEKHYTCFPGFEKYVAGGIFTEGGAVLDGKILTGRGAGTAGDFGFKMVEIFKGEDAANSLKSQMQYE